MTEAELVVFRQLAFYLADATIKLNSLVRTHPARAHVDSYDNAIELAHEILAEYGDTPEDAGVDVAAEAAYIGANLTPDQTERDLIPTKPIP